MTRNIICRECSKGRYLDRIDALSGWKQREVLIVVETESQCDMCTVPLQGTIAVAETRWDCHHEKGIPRAWETEFGTVIPKETAKVHAVLTRAGSGRDIDDRQLSGD